MAGRTNRNYQEALAYVATHYASLLALVARIEFQPKYGRGFNGQCYSYDGKVFVHIYNGQRNVAEFVGTLVHELTHAHQQTFGRPGTSREQRECEAEEAGYQARCQYRQEVSK